MLSKKALCVLGGLENARELSGLGPQRTVCISEVFRPPGTPKEPREADPEGSALSAKALCVLGGLENARSFRVQGAGFRVCALTGPENAWGHSLSVQSCS